MRDSGADAAATVGSLIDVCREEEHGFLIAAAAVRDPTLERLFQSYARQRAEFAAELEQAAGKLASEVAGWQSPRRTGRVNLGDGNGDETTIISHCQVSEGATLRQYREALVNPLPQQIRGIVQRQFLQVKEAHDHMRALESAQPA